jgi:cobalt-zinc-cadmium resistance protein CzcA
MVTYIMQLEQRGASIHEAVIRGAQTRLRPVLMTALVAVVGLMPKVLFHGTGTEVQRPLATVILGGLVTATALTLIVLPALYKMLNQVDESNEKAA